jgi:hypothetical protein
MEARSSIPQFRHFNCQHGGNSEFADVHGISLQYATRSGNDCDINFNLEPRRTASIESGREGCSGLVVSFHFSAFSDHTLQDSFWASSSCARFRGLQRVS